MPQPHRPSSQEVGREIDDAKPSPAVKRAVERDLEDHLPANMIPGQATEEPLKKSQREVQDDEAPGS